MNAKIVDPQPAKQAADPPPTRLAGRLIGATVSSRDESNGYLFWGLVALFIGVPELLAAFSKTQPCSRRSRFCAGVPPGSPRSSSRSWSCCCSTSPSTRGPTTTSGLPNTAQISARRIGETTSDLTGSRADALRRRGDAGLLLLDHPRKPCRVVYVI